MKHATKREVRRLREKRRQEELGRYIALCVQAQILCELEPGIRDLMNSAMKAAEHLSYGVLRSSVQELQSTLDDIALGTTFFKAYYLVQHWLNVCRQTSIHPRTHDHEKTSATSRPDPVRPPTKISGQAARFQNYRR